MSKGLDEEKAFGAQAQRITGQLKARGQSLPPGLSVNWLTGSVESGNAACSIPCEVPTFTRSTNSSATSFLFSQRESPEANPCLLNALKASGPRPTWSHSRSRTRMRIQTR